MKSIEKIFVSSKYAKEMESIEKEIDQLQGILPKKLENMIGEEQIEIMKKLFSKKHGIMNKLAATDDSSDSKFNQIARRINDHSDNPLNIHRNNILDKANYLRNKFSEGGYHKNIIQSSELKNDKLSKLRKEFEDLSYSFARKNQFSIEDVLTDQTDWLGKEIRIYWDEKEPKKLFVKRIDSSPFNRYDGQDYIGICRKQDIDAKDGKNYIDECSRMKRERDEILKEYKDQLRNYTQNEIRNILRATSDYTDFIKCVKNEFADYYKKQYKLSTKTLGGEQKRRFAQICMNLKYNPPTEEQIRRQILELKAKALKRASKVTNAVLDEMSIDLIREN